MLVKLFSPLLPCLSFCQIKINTCICRGNDRGKEAGGYQLFPAEEKL